MAEWGLGQPVSLVSAHPRDAGHEGRTRFGASGFRKLFHSISFLLLAPFFVSLPAMLWQRFSAGVWLDTWGLLVLAVLFAAIMLLLLGELVNALRSRITLGETGVRYTLPARIGPFTRLVYRSGEVAYADIERIETRREVYGGALAPVFMTGARIVTKSGDTHSLGYVNDANADPAMPIRAIAVEIARRAGVPIEDKGNVERSVVGKVRGVRASDTPLTEAAIASLNGRHNLLVAALVVALLVLLALGIYEDIITPVG